MSGHESGARRWCALIIVVATLDGLSHPWPRARRRGRRSGSKWGRGRIGVGADVTRVARLGYSGATLSVAPHAFVQGSYSCIPIPEPDVLQLYCKHATANFNQIKAIAQQLGRAFNKG